VRDDPAGDGRRGGIGNVQAGYRAGKRLAVDRAAGPGRPGLFEYRGAQEGVPPKRGAGIPG